MSFVHIKKRSLLAWFLAGAVLISSMLLLQPAQAKSSSQIKNEISVQNQKIQEAQKKVKQLKKSAADQQERKSIRLEETKVKSGRKLHIRLQSGGGYLARIERVGGR